MKGYKAFEKGMVCIGKQYAENTVFEEDKAVPCECGMHFVSEENPLELLEYYPLVDENGNMSEFAKVEALDEPITDDNKKYCSKRLKIGAKISFPALVQAAVNFECEKTPKDTRIKTASKNNARIGSSGDSAQIGSSGDFARIGSSGDSAQIGSSGDFAQIGSSGDSARIGSSGNFAQIGSSGDFARIGSSGDSAQIGSSGNFAQIGSTGKHAVICCAGADCAVRAKKGSWITLSEWKWSDEDNANIPVCVKTVKVDGETIKEDTLYKLINGEFTEAEG